MDKQPKPVSPAAPGPHGGEHSSVAGPLGYHAADPFAEPAPGDQPVLDGSGVTVERLRYEQEQAYYNELYLLAPVGYFLIGFDTTILQVNLVGADMVGIVRAEALAYHFRSFIRPSFMADFDCTIGVALNCSTPHECRLQMCSTSGAHFDVTLRASCDGSGQACRVVVERAEGKLAALERSEERFRRIVHSACEGIWEIDAMSCTSFVNPRMADMLGYPIEQLIGRPLSDFMDEEGKALMDRNIERRQHGIAACHEYKFQRRDGSALWTTMATNPIFDAAGGYMGALALVTDITDQHNVAAHVWQQANFDVLTGLPNRHMLMHRLEQEVGKADRSATFVALLKVGLQDAADLLARHGRVMADQVQVEMARRIASSVRATDLVARSGDDGFGVIVAGQDHIGGVERLARSMLALLALPYDFDGVKLTVAASVGIALYPADAANAADLADRASLATQAARADGAPLAYFTPELQDGAQQRRVIATELREALALGQFEILYQPIVSLQTGQVHKAEALLRWRHPTRGLLAPAQFIPFAEAEGLIVAIGDWVFREAARQALRWQGLIDPAFQVSVNKSPLQFRRDVELYEGWLAYLAELDLPTNSIIVEITESMLQGGVEHVIERLRQYRALGLQVSLDDFGTGYASLSHLKRFDVDFVKIDQSFVATLQDDQGDLLLCEAIIAMAHALGLKVVAEGVETALQRALLVDAGCDYGQGYMFAHPMTAAQFEAMAVAAVPDLPH